MAATLNPLQSSSTQMTHNQHAIPKVCFPAGKTQLQTKIVDVIEHNNLTWLVLEETPVHPRDFRWPDQPRDKARFSLHDLDLKDSNQSSFPLIDAVKILYTTQGYLIDTDIKYSQKEMPEDAYLVVGHCIDASQIDIDNIQALKGQNLAVIVDESQRAAYSTGHSIGHLFSFALNEILSPYWRKPVPTDARGFQDFVSLSLDESKVSNFSTTDKYRLGKSLRKSGFNTADMLAQLPQIMGTIETTLAQWLALQPIAWIESQGLGLGDSRVWHCTIGSESLSMFCGGTHLKSFADIQKIDIKYNFDAQLKTLAVTVTSCPIISIELSKN